MTVDVQDIKKVIIWGNHSTTQFPDVSHAMVNLTCVNDRLSQSWIQHEFIPTVQKRGAAVIEARKLSSAMSAAKASGDHMKYWFSSTPDDDWLSMAVVSDGSYGTPPGVIFSFPVVIKEGEWSIVQGLTMTKFAKQMIQVTGWELCKEREEALSVCSAIRIMKKWKPKK